MTPTPIHDAAFAAHAAGLSVVPPAEDGSKKPLSTWKRYQHVRAAAEQLHAWYLHDRRTGLGAVCGTVSGNLEVLEFDDRGVYDRFVALACQSGLGDLVQRIEAGYVEDTPSGGVHWLYRCETISGNTKLATRPKRPEERRDPKDTIKTLIETRGEGGFIILAPSNGTVHQTGGAYRLRAGSFATLPTLTPDDRRALHQLAKTFHQPDAKEAAQFAKTAAADAGGRPGDDFNARASWADVLAGWTAVFTANDETSWRRPGKAVGTSATTNHGGLDLLIVFSTSTPFAATTTDAKRGYTKFAAYAVLHHAGDFAAAARALKAEGFGEDAGEGSIYADRVDPHTVDLVWERLVRHNTPATLFRRQRNIVIPVAEEVASNFHQLFARQLKLQIAQTCEELNGAQFVEVDLDLFTELLARAVPFVREVGREGHRSPMAAYPSQRLVKQVMASPVCPLPLARGLIRTPSFDAAGTLIREPGYHAASGIFYAPPPGFELPEVPAAPREDAVIAALLLWHEVVRDFPFVDVAGRAHILGLALTVLARELIAGPVPMCLVSKPATGTGGTLLLQCVGWIVLGESLPEASWSSDQEELRKFLTTLLMRGRALVNLDNITYLHSKDLLSVLSGGVREDRRLGGNELLTIPNRAAFVGSGNNVTYDEEHAGRLVVSRLDAGVENPRLRDMTFRHPALFAWVQAHRPVLVAALLTIIQAWLAAKRPAYTGKRLAGFEAWSNVIGGILQHARVEGFLDNRDDVMRRAQQSQEEDVAFVAAWHGLMTAKTPTLGGAVRTRDLLDSVGMAGALPAPKKGTAPTPIALGRFLERQVDRIHTLDGGAQVVIRRAEEDKHAKTQRWTLVVLKAGAAQAPAAGAPKTASQTQEPGAGAQEPGMDEVPF